MDRRFLNSSFFRQRASKRVLGLHGLAALLFATFLLLTRSSIGRHLLHSDSTQQLLTKFHTGETLTIPTYKDLPLPTRSKYAFATLLARESEDTPDCGAECDHYFVAARMLTYQLRHALETKSDIPLIIIVTPELSEDKRQRLRSDGAIVWEAEPVDPGLVHTVASNWQNTLTKFRLWQLTQFERIVFLDADTILFRPMSGIFDDQAVSAGTIEADEEIVLPSEYVFAANKETEYSHHWPPVEEHVDFPNIDYLNTGLMVLRPDLRLLEYYLSLLWKPELFDIHFMEQGLLNYAHRREGRMPWKQVDIMWGLHFPTLQDIEGGVHSVHEKWWDPFHKEVTPLLQMLRWRMKGFYEARELCNC